MDRFPNNSADLRYGVSQSVCERRVREAWLKRGGLGRGLSEWDLRNHPVVDEFVRSL
jgi:hypothetical protein